MAMATMFREESCRSILMAMGTMLHQVRVATVDTRTKEREEMAMEMVALESNIKMGMATTTEEEVPTTIRDSIRTTMVEVAESRRARQPERDNRLSRLRSHH